MEPMQSSLIQLKIYLDHQLKDVDGSVKTKWLFCMFPLDLQSFC